MAEPHAPARLHQICFAISEIRYSLLVTDSKIVAISTILDFRTDPPHSLGASLIIMLLRFRASNHRSILDPVEISMVAIDEDRVGTRSFETVPEQALSVVGIYGPNATGKSNVLDAIAWLSDAVATSLRSWDEDIPREHHSFGLGAKEPSNFDLDMVVDGIRYCYELEVDDACIRHEALYSYPKRSRRMLFSREQNDIKIRSGLSSARGLKGLLEPTALTLSSALRLRDPDIGNVADAIANMVILTPRRRRILQSDTSRSSIHLFAREMTDQKARRASDPATRALAIRLLRCADPEISEVELVETAERYYNNPYSRLRFVREIDETPRTLDFFEESSGTQAWFRIIGPLLAAIREGRILLFDEIDAHLHPRLSAYILELFQDQRINTRRAQLLFTAHDTSLLYSLYRDEVWLTDKDPYSCTSLRALADFRDESVTKSLNLARSYLDGRFGSVPEIEKVAVRNAFGPNLEQP